MKNKNTLTTKAEDDADYILKIIMRRSRCSAIIRDELVAALAKVSKGEILARKPKRKASK